MPARKQQGMTAANTPGFTRPTEPAKVEAEIPVSEFPGGLDTPVAGVEARTAAHHVMAGLEPGTGETLRFMGSDEWDSYNCAGLSVTRGDSAEVPAMKAQQLLTDFSDLWTKE